MLVFGNMGLGSINLVAHSCEALALVIGTRPPTAYHGFWLLRCLLAGWLVSSQSVDPYRLDHGVQDP